MAFKISFCRVTRKVGKSLSCSPKKEMKLPISLNKAAITEITGPKIIATHKSTRTIDQKECILFLVFLSSQPSGLCKITAKKNESKNGAAITKQYLKNT